MSRQRPCGCARVGPQAVAAYRDTFRFLLAFLKQLRGREPSRPRLDDVDATAIQAFLDNLEPDRKSSVRSLTEQFHEAFFQERMPLCLKNPGGNIWLEKT